MASSVSATSAQLQEAEGCGASIFTKLIGIRPERPRPRVFWGCSARSRLLFGILLADDCPNNYHIQSKELESMDGTGIQSAGDEQA